MRKKANERHVTVIELGGIELSYLELMMENAEETKRSADAGVVAVMRCIAAEHGAELPKGALLLHHFRLDYGDPLRPRLVIDTEV